jgi:hypothetical protein
MVSFFLFLFPSNSEAQNIPEKEYSRILELPGNTKDLILLNINTWVVDKFKNNEIIIEFSDKENGIIRATYTFKRRGSPNSYLVTSSLSIEVRNDRCRIQISNPVQRRTMYADVPFDLTTPSRPVTDAGLLTMANEQWKSLVDSLEQYLKQNQSDW